MNVNEITAAPFPRKRRPAPRTGHVPKGSLGRRVQFFSPESLIQALDTRAANLGVSRERLIGDVLLTWEQGVRQYELENGLSTPGASDLPIPAVDGSRNYVHRLGSLSESVLDAGLESL